MMALSAGPRCSLRRSTIRPHALLDRSVLHVDPVDAGEAFGPLHLAINQVIVLSVGFRAEGRLIDMQRPVAEPAFEAVLVVEWFVGPAIGPVVDLRRLVIDRDPNVSGIGWKPALGR